MFSKQQLFVGADCILIGWRFAGLWLAAGVYHMLRFGVLIREIAVNHLFLLLKLGWVDALCVWNFVAAPFVATMCPNVKVNEPILIVNVKNSSFVVYLVGRWLLHRLLVVQNILAVSVARGGRLVYWFMDVLVTLFLNLHHGGIAVASPVQVSLLTIRLLVRLVKVLVRHQVICCVLAA